MSLLFNSSLCSENHQNSFCRCINRRLEDRPEYKQYNGGDQNIKGRGSGYYCCNTIFASPSIISTLPIAEQPTTEINSPSEYLDLLSKLNFVPCDYNKYMGDETSSARDVYMQNNFQELYDYTDVQRKIFNNFFLYIPQNYPSTITSNTDLIPETTNDQIICKEGMIPLILKYDDQHSQSDQFILVCRPNGAPVPDLGFQYNLLYYYDVNENPCKRNKCVTKYSPWDGYNFDDEGPGESTSKKNEDIWYNKKVIIAPIIGGIILILFIIYIVLIIQDRKNEKKKKELLVEFRK